jgi:ubiquinone/menaquinone biosynthesis C-methylase UbiE
LPESTFKDHFSGHAGSYAAHRPGYPGALFEYLATHCPERELAWDCATGNGQAARSLAPYFRRVVATDASAEQIAAATPETGVEFLVAPAEASALVVESVDLITVAQALHWFNIERFFEEASRVLKPGGILAWWTYHHCSAGPDIDAIIEAVFDAVDDYWPPEREIVENRYRDVLMPFREIAAGPFSMSMSWSAGDIMNYMGTWSATQRFRAETGRDPLETFRPAMAAAWGDGQRTVTWPLILRVGQK